MSEQTLPKTGTPATGTAPGTPFFADPGLIKMTTNRAVVIIVATTTAAALNLLVILTLCFAVIPAVRDASKHNLEAINETYNILLKNQAELEEHRATIRRLTHLLDDSEERLKMQKLKEEKLRKEREERENKRKKEAEEG